MSDEPTNTYVVVGYEATGFGLNDMTITLRAVGPFSVDEVVPMLGADVKIVPAR